MRAWKLLALPVAVLAFGCEGSQKRGEQPTGEPQQQQDEIQQVGGQPETSDEAAPAEEPEPDEMGQVAPVAPQETAVVRATVKEVLFGEGKLVLDAEGGPLTLRARPFDLRQLVPGDVVQVSYGSYGQENWVVPTGQWDVDVSSYGQQTTLTGPIEDLDANTGTMRIRAQEVHVHPAQIAELTKGQFVQTTFVSIDGQNWVAKLAPMQAPPPEGT